MLKSKFCSISHLHCRPRKSPPHSKFLRMTYNVWWRIFLPFVKKDIKTVKNIFLTIYFLIMIFFSPSKVEEVLMWKKIYFGLLSYSKYQIVNRNNQLLNYWNWIKLISSFIQTLSLLMYMELVYFTSLSWWVFELK